MSCCKCESIYRLGLMIALSFLQLACNVIALALPEYVVGDIPKQQAERWQSGKIELSTQVSRKSAMEKVPTHIGLFESSIDGITDGNNRQGLSGVFGFAMVSTLSSFFTFIFSMQVFWHYCGECCEKCCTFMSKKLQDVVKTNFSAGVSGVTVAAMVGFSADDLTGKSLGTSSALTVAGGVSAFVFHFVQVDLKKDDFDRSSRGATSRDYETEIV